MRKTLRLVVVLATVPYLTGCFTITSAALPPSPEARQDLDVRGVVVGPGEGEWVEFQEVLDVTWTDDRVRIVGRQQTDNGMNDVTREFQLSSLSGVLVRRLDAGKTSGVVGGVMVGALAVLAVLVSGSDPRNR